MWWVNAAAAFVAPLLIAWTYSALSRYFTFTGTWVSSAAGGILGGTVLSWQPAWLAGSVASLVAAVAAWFYRRKRKDPAARQFGAKSRARIAALVARVREAAKPRRVLRPMPGGAS